MPNVSFPGRRLATLSVALLVALLVGGADGCSGDVNMRSAAAHRASATTTAPGLARRGARSRTPKTSTRSRSAPTSAGCRPTRRPTRRRASALLEQMTADIERAYRSPPTTPTCARCATTAGRPPSPAATQALTNASVEPSVAQVTSARPHASCPTRRRPHLRPRAGLPRAPTTRPRRSRPFVKPSVARRTTSRAHIYLSRALLLSEQGAEGVTVIEAAATRFPGNDGRAGGAAQRLRRLGTDRRRARALRGRRSPPTPTTRSSAPTTARCSCAPSATTRPSCS